MAVTGVYDRCVCLCGGVCVHIWTGDQVCELTHVCLPHNFWTGKYCILHAGLVIRQSLCIRIPKIISFLGIGKIRSAKIIVFNVQKYTINVWK